MNLQEYINKHESNKEKSSDFVTYLYELMDKKGIEKNSFLYDNALITKQAFSKIISGKVLPSLSTCIKFAFVLHLDKHECKYLLKKAGYTLSSSSRFSLIVRYCLENQIYDFGVLNEYLEQYNLEPLL